MKELLTSSPRIAKTVNYRFAYFDYGKLLIFIVANKNTIHL